MSLNHLQTGRTFPPPKSVCKWVSNSFGLLLAFKQPKS